MEYLIHLAESLVLSAIRYSIKNPQHAETIKGVLLSIRDAINEQYPETTGDGAPIQ